MDKLSPPVKMEEMNPSSSPGSNGFESLPSSSSMTAAKNEDQIVAGLFAAADTISLLEQIPHFVRDVERLRRAKRGQEEWADQCAAMERALDMERRAHVEQLREINEDLNQLETIVRPLGGEQECEQRRGELDRRMEHTDDLERALSEGDHQRAAEELKEKSGGEGLPQPAETSGQSQLFDNAAQLQLLFAAAAMAAFQQQQQYQLAAEQAQRQTQGATGSREGGHQQPRMKECQHCHKLIHRNAPVCPVCKHKIISKAAKRSRK